MPIVALIVASLIPAGAVVWAAVRITTELRVARETASQARMATLLQLFAPALSAAQTDPRAYLAWQPLAKMARDLFPAESAVLDRAAGGSFPFTTAQLQAAHAQWTTDWLAWERTHDAEYKLKAAVAAEAIASSGDPATARARLDATESEKLDLYQRRYAEYVRVAKAFQALIG